MGHIETLIYLRIKQGKKMETILQKDKTSFPTFDDILKKINNNSRKSRDEIISDLKKIIIQYEKKYHMSTEEFLPRFKNGDYEMDDNYLDYELLDWWGTNNTYQKYLNGDK